MDRPRKRSTCVLTPPQRRLGRHQRRVKVPRSALTRRFASASKIIRASISTSKLAKNYASPVQSSSTSLGFGPHCYRLRSDCPRSKTLPMESRNPPESQMYPRRAHFSQASTSHMQGPETTLKVTHPALHIRNVNDVLVILEAVRRGILPLITLRLSGSEREELRSGNVFVWEESVENGGLVRWTDGRRWSQSKVCAECLFYQEKIEVTEEEREAKALRRLDSAISSTTSLIFLQCEENMQSRDQYTPLLEEISAPPKPEV
ncbi:hypothetical protein MSAN_00616000 [Mycena sanguinolenta]|uniref:cAMP-independent regulatory protein pac2 n=1 Tax=Mycena sanguinolenta TaxID=230812 RepID=A0A8H6Z2Q7_9AGAR|nr:hypothetical protein MSAN_00616000 [Mycena sanguinolenta]